MFYNIREFNEGWTDRRKSDMNIVVLAGGLSTERDVSLTTGNMVSNALKKKGHRVLLLDVFMGYSDKEEDITGILNTATDIQRAMGTTGINPASGRWCNILKDTITTDAA